MKLVRIGAVLLSEPPEFAQAKHKASTPRPERNRLADGSIATCSRSRFRKLFVHAIKCAGL